MKRNNRFKLVIVLMAITFLCGCWDVRDIDQRTSPLLIGISKGSDDEFQVTLNVPITQRKKIIPRIITEKGKTVYETLGKIRTNSDDALDYRQVQLLIIHNDLAMNEEEMGKLIQLAMKIEQLPSKVFVVITDEDIETIMSNVDKMVGVQISNIQNYFYKMDWSPEVSNTRIWEMYRSLYSYTQDMTVPVVTSGKDTVFHLEGFAIFNKGKMVGRINLKENLLVKLFNHYKVVGEYLNTGSAGVVIRKSSVHIKPSMKNNEPLVSCDLKLKIEVMQRSKEGVTDVQIQEELKKLIEKLFHKIFEQAQKNQADIFGFGQYFRNRIPYHELKDWREKYYPQLKVDLQVQVSLT